MRFAANRYGPYFEGQLLVATPGNPDAAFSDSIVFVLSHSEEGAMGLVMNKASTDRRLAEVLKQLDIIDDENTIRVGSRAHAMPVIHGGPHDTDRGFVIHSSEFVTDQSTALRDGLHMTVSVDILRAIADDRGPDRAVLAFGYVGWKSGELEREIKDDWWFPCDTDNEFLFGIDNDAKHARALGLIGISDSSALRMTSGRA